MKRIVLFAVGLAAARCVTAQPAGWVAISVSEYGALRAKAFPAEAEPAQPPLDVALTRVDYDLRVNGDLATGQALLTLDVFKDGWVRVPVPSGMLVREAKLAGGAASIIPAPTKEDRQMVAILSHAGRSTLTLDMAAPVATSGGFATVTLPPTKSGIERAVLTLPKQDVDLTLTGGILTERAEAAGEMKWQAHGDGLRPLVFTWRRKVEERRVELPLRFKGTVTELVGLGEDSSSINAEVSVEVIQGAAQQVRALVPAAVEVNQVLGASVADWEAKTGVLTVRFLEPVEKAVQFVVAGEVRLPREGEIEAPLVRLPDAERETGGVAVETLGAGEIKGRKVEGLERADAEELGQTIANRQSPSLAAFRFRGGAATAARSLTVNVVRYAQQAMLTANVEEARYRALMSQEGKALVQARYAVRNSHRNFVKIALPAGAAVWSASLQGRPVRPGQAEDGGLLFPLSKAQAGEDAPAFAIEILFLARGDAWSDKGQATLALPSLDMPVSRTGVQVYHSPLFRVATEPGAFREEEYEGPVAAALKSVAVQTVEAPRFEAKRDASQAANTQALVNEFLSNTRARKPAVTLPANLTFPAVGPSLYLVSELTAENQVPSIVLSYQRQKKGGL